MYENIEIGSIVLLMNNEFNIYKAIIVQKNIIENGKYYKYLAIPYPYGFVGIDNYTFINEDNIYDIVYSSQNKDEENSNELCISSVIEYNKQKYLIIGKNVKYLGKEKENEYAIVKYGENAYDIKYIFGYEIDKVITYGFINEEYMDLDKGRYNHLNLSIRRYRSFLPLGSIVELQTNDEIIVYVMIVDRNIEDEGVIFDYTGIIYDPKNIYSNLIFNFDKNQVLSVKYIGYFDIKEKEYNKKILISRGIIDLI